MEKLSRRYVSDIEYSKVLVFRFIICMLHVHTNCVGGI